MKDNENLYKSIEIEIADYIFAHPEKKTAEITAEFCGKLRKKLRTVEGYLANAKKYNAKRLKIDEQIKDEVRHEQIKDAVKTAILSRELRLEILSDIAAGKRKDSDPVRAVLALEKIDPTTSVATEASVNERERAVSKILQKQLPVFAPLFYDDFNYMDLVGGRGRGASYAMSCYLIGGVLGEDYFRAVAMRYNDTSISTGVWQDLTDRIAEFGLEKLLKVTGTPRKIVNLENGNMIVTSGFVGSQEKVKGLAGFNVVVIDEANEVPEFHINKLFDTIRTIKGKNRIIRAFNPPSRRHWIWKDYTIEPVDSGYIYKPKDNANLTAIISDYNDNYYLSDSYLERINYKRENDPDYYYQQYAGLITDKSAARIFNWTTCTEEEFDNVDSGKVYGLDFGFSIDPNALVCIKKQGRNIYVKELIYRTNQRDVDLMREMNELGVTYRDTIIADRDPNRIANLIAGTDSIRGFSVFKAEKPKVAQRISIEKEYNLIVCETSNNLIDELSEYNWKIDRDGVITDEPVDKNNHLCDAKGYAILYAHKYGI